MAWLRRGLSYNRSSNKEEDYAIQRKEKVDENETENHMLKKNSREMWTNSILAKWSKKEENRNGKFFSLPSIGLYLPAFAGNPRLPVTITAIWFKTGYCGYHKRFSVLVVSPSLFTFSSSSSSFFLFVQCPIVFFLILGDSWSSFMGLHQGVCQGRSWDSIHLLFL